MSWTDERVEKLKQLWGSGMTAAQIAEELGTVSRNAVIGKAHRLGLSVSKKPVARPAHKPMLPRPKRAAVAPVTAPVPPAPPPRPDVRAEDLPWHRRCQWPIGHPGDDDFHFCGAVAAAGKPYCPQHCAAAYRHKDEAA
jgi:GcrA cell cycle regulator